MTETTAPTATADTIAAAGPRPASWTPEPIGSARDLAARAAVIALNAAQRLALLTIAALGGQQLPGRVHGSRLSFLRDRGLITLERVGTGRGAWNYPRLTELGQDTAHLAAEDAAAQAAEDAGRVAELERVLEANGGVTYRFTGDPADPDTTLPPFQTEDGATDAVLAGETLADAATRLRQQPEQQHQAADAPAEPEGTATQSALEAVNVLAHGAEDFTAGADQLAQEVADRLNGLEAQVAGLVRTLAESRALQQRQAAALEAERAAVRALRDDRSRSVELVTRLVTALTRQRDGQGGELFLSLPSSRAVSLLAEHAGVTIPPHQVARDLGLAPAAEPEPEPDHLQVLENAGLQVISLAAGMATEVREYVAQASGPRKVRTYGVLERTSEGLTFSTGHGGPRRADVVPLQLLGRYLAAVESAGYPGPERRRGLLLAVQTTSDAR